MKNKTINIILFIAMVNIIPFIIYYASVRMNNPVVYAIGMLSMTVYISSRFIIEAIKSSNNKQ